MTVVLLGFFYVIQSKRLQFILTLFRMALIRLSFAVCFFYVNTKKRLQISIGFCSYPYISYGIPCNCSCLL